MSAVITVAFYFVEIEGPAEKFSKRYKHSSGSSFGWDLRSISVFSWPKNRIRLPTLFPPQSGENSGLLRSVKLFMKL